MPTPDEQLVKLVADQVLAALQSKRREQGAASPVHINPPIGVCTGDYSQFTDRPDLSGGAMPQAAGPATARDAALGGIITAAQLQEAIDASPDKVALLAPDARLTPLAADFAREHPDKVKRGQKSAIRHPQPEKSPWLWWADAHCPAVQNIASTHRQRLRPSAAGRNATGMLQVIRDLKVGIANRSLLGGLLFVSSSARAALLANRCGAIRAVVGSCEEAVNEAVRELGANVLIVEYPYTSEKKMSAMVAAMLDQSPTVSPHLERELADLQRSPER